MKILTLLLLSIVSAAAQYSLDWTTSDAGGGESSGGSYALHGSIAQPDAADPSTGGGYTFQGGYWTFPDITAPLPELTMTLDGGYVILTWSDPGFPLVLESSEDLALWLPADPPPEAGMWAEIESARRFYRLRAAP